MQALINFLLLTQRMKKLYAAMCEPVCALHALTRLELDIMLFLENNPELDTASDIVEVRMISKSHVSTTVESLIAKGLLSRQDDRCDRRRVRLKLTARADAILADARDMQASFAKRLFKGLDEGERALLGSLVNRMLDNFL